MSDLLSFLAPWSGRALTLACILLGLAFAALFLRRKKLKVPHCPHCGYNLTAATSPACAECGHVPKNQASLYRGRRRWRLVIFGLLISLAMPVFVAQRRMRQEGWGYYLRFPPLYYLWPEKCVEDYKFQHGIRATLWQDRYISARSSDYTVERLAVTIDGQPVWPRSKTESFSYWYIDDTLPPHTLVDLAGDGLIDLPIYAASDPWHSPGSTHILSFDCSSGQAVLVKTTTLDNCWFQKFKGPNRGGVYSAETTCFWPHPRLPDLLQWYTADLWVKFGAGGIALDAESTRQPLPDPAVIATALRLAQRLDLSGARFDTAIRLALDMIYTGHARAGFDLLAQIEPDYLKAFPQSEFPLRQTIMRQLLIMPFGKELLQMDHYPVPALNATQP